MGLAVSHPIRAGDVCTFARVVDQIFPREQAAPETSISVW